MISFGKLWGQIDFLGNGYVDGIVYDLVKNRLLKLRSEQERYDLQRREFETFVDYVDGVDMVLAIMDTMYRVNMNQCDYWGGYMVFEDGGMIVCSNYPTVHPDLCYCKRSLEDSESGYLYPLLQIETEQRIIDRRSGSVLTFSDLYGINRWLNRMFVELKDCRNRQDLEKYFILESK